MSFRFTIRSTSTIPQRLMVPRIRFDPPVVAMALFIIFLHIVGWATLIFLVRPLHLSVDSKVFGLGIGTTAYTLGMRHAFDADHIAAIDNTTRKLVGEGKRALSIGFWFSFGHSTIVFGLTLLVSLGMQSLSGYVTSPGAAFHTLAGIIGTSVSSGFLYLVAALNMTSFLGIFRVFRRMKSGHYDEAHLEQQLEHRGVINRVLTPLMRLVHKPGQMYFVGLLFGLGFDTATEIALLVMTGSGAASGLPWYATLCIPILFASGILLFDTIDGFFMNFAYTWASSRPARKIYYNLVVTGLSIIVALVIGTIEVLGFFNDALSICSGFCSFVSRIDLNDLGFVIVGLFIAAWIISIAIWKFGRAQEKRPAIQIQSFEDAK